MTLTPNSQNTQSTNGNIAERSLFHLQVPERTAPKNSKSVTEMDRVLHIRSGGKAHLRDEAYSYTIRSSTEGIHDGGGCD